MTYSSDNQMPPTFSVVGFENDDDEDTSNDSLIEFSPEAALIYQTSNYINNGVPIPPELFFADYQYDIENASGELILKLVEVFQTFGFNPGDLSNYDSFIASVKSMVE